MTTRRQSLAVAVRAALLASAVSLTPIALAADSEPLDGMAFAGDGVIDVFVRLDTPSVSELNIENLRATGRRAPPAAQARHAQQISSEQAVVQPKLEQHGAQVMSALRVGVNGFRVRVDASELDNLRLLDGVLSVEPVDLHYPENALSVPGIGAPAVWEQIGTGEGVSIAIIDSGIDYLHANLGGSGDPAEYAANDPTTLEDGGFPNAKVVGGFDFVGNDYNAGDPANNVPMPDPDPLDCNTGNAGGHGSHVAGSAAGLGVPGKIGPGVAPGADLYALKVFGCSGSTAVTVDAIEWAMDPNADGDMSDHLDVINMSLGATRGNPTDASAIAASHAAELGIIVVASAGNSGAQPYVVGSPSVSPATLSVAASSKGFSLAINVTEPPSVAGLYEAVEAAFGVPLATTGNIDGELVAPENPANFEGCAPWGNDASDKIALVFRGVCPFQAKFDQAVAAGAKAVIVGNNAPNAAPIVMGGTASPVPGVMITLEAGQALAGALATDTVAAELSPSDFVVASAFGNQIAGFSSRGPGHGGGQFKPEITGPGVAIQSTGVGTGTEPASLSGTSMSAPHLAGVGALLRQAFPDKSVAAIKAMIMNSAANMNTGGITLPLSRQGTGRVDALAAVNLTSYATPAGVSFGRINKAVQNVSASESVTVTDFGGSTRTFSVTHLPNLTLPGVSVSCPGSVKVHGNKSNSFKINLTLNSSVAEAAGAFDNASNSQTEVDGWCVLSDGMDTLKVGYLAIVDPASNQLATKAPGLNNRIVNTGPASGPAQGFTFVKSGEENPAATQGAIADVGFRTNMIGTIPVVEIAIATQMPWELPSQNQINIFLDTDGDGVDDLRLVAGDWSTLQVGGTVGVLVTAQLDPVTGSGPLDFIVGGVDFNDRTLFLPFRLDRGLIPSSFDYRVEFVPRGSPTGLQHGSIDFSDEIFPSAKSFLMGPGQNVIVGTSAPGTMLWLFQNNEVSTQAQRVTSQ